MIDDIKDLSLIQKQKQLKRRRLGSAFGKTFPLTFIAAEGMALFGIMITGEFLNAFTVENAFADDDEDDDDTPDFLKRKPAGGNKSKFEKLEFGNNTNNGNNKNKKRR